MSSSGAPTLTPGDRRVVERVFLVDEVRTFATLSGDTGAQHVAADAQGRLMVHGLLVASLPTRVGGELNFLAREFVFEFLRPVWTGEKVVCTVTLVKVEPVPKGTRLESSWECTNPAGDVVMRGKATGLVPAMRPREG